MIRISAFLWCCALSVGACADEIVLADGTSIKWKSIVRSGQFYEVLTEDGKRVKVAKADVQKITVDSVSSVLLTGATVQLKAQPAINLVQRIDPKRDAISGSWQLSQGGLRVSLSTAPCILEVPYEPPEEYDVHVTVERVEGTDFFMIGLVAGGKQFGVTLDGYEGKVSTLNNVATSGLNEATVNQKEPLLKRGTPRAVLCKVRREGLRVEVDGEKLFEYSGYDRITPPPGYQPKSPTRLYVACVSAGLKVSKYIATPYAREEKK